jgi:hypothetical protein
MQFDFYENQIPVYVFAFLTSGTAFIDYSKLYTDAYMKYAILQRGDRRVKIGEKGRPKPIVALPSD